MSERDPSTRGKSTLATRLVWVHVLIAMSVGIFLFIATTSSISEIREKREVLSRLDEELKQFYSTLDGIFNRQQAYNSKKNQEDERLFLKATENVSRLLTANQNDTKLMQCLSDSVSAYGTLLANSNAERTEIEQADIELKLSKKMLDDALVSLRSNLNSEIGLQRINYVKSFKAIDIQNKDHVADQLRGVGKSNARIFKLIDTRVEAYALQVLLETLHSIEDGNRLNDLKDNQLAPILFRLKRSDLFPDSDVLKAGFDSAIKQINELVLGSGYELEESSQSIALGQSGLINLYRKRIANRQSTAITQSRLFACLEEVAAYRSRVQAVLGKKYNDQAKISEMAIERIWNNAFPVGAIAGVLFLFLSAIIAASVKKQVLAVDIANQKMLAALQTSEISLKALKYNEAMTKKLAMVAGTTDNAVLVTDGEGQIEWANNSGAKMLFNGTVPPSLGRIDTAISLEDSPCILKSIQSGEERHISGSCRTLSGEKLWLEIELKPLRNEIGKIDNYVILAQNVTQRKEMELQLAQSQKLESIGQLAAGIAHEINTPIQFIGDNARFLQDAFKDLSEVVASHRMLAAEATAGSVSPECIAQAEKATRKADLEYLNEEIPRAIEQALEGVSRVANIVSAMKEFSHPGVKEKIAIDINHAIETTLTVARNEWKYVADLTIDFDAELPHMPCLPGEFNQVILNLVVNAAHAIGDVVKTTGGKGVITISTRKDGDMCVIRIADTGTGIPESARQRIFDPFFTTKEVGKGTGQGLAIARSVIVEKHGGTLEFETEIGKGTTFIIKLPVSDPIPREVGYETNLVRG